MAAKNKLVIRNPNAIADIRKRVADAAISVGVQSDAGMHKDDDGQSSGTTVAEIYYWNELGTSLIPERPTLRPTFIEQKEKYIGILKVISAKAMEQPGYNMKQAMGRLGEVAQQDIQNSIVELRSPPNAQSTIEAKGSDNPLVDTGQLVSSIRWAYVKPEHN